MPKGMIKCHWCGKEISREFVQDIINDKEVCVNCSVKLHEFYCCFCELYDKDDKV
jgi:hypothetical protein